LADHLLGWMIWGVSKIASVEIPGLVYAAFYFTMAVVASFVIVRFRWGNLAEVQRGFPVITEIPEATTKPVDPGLCSDDSSGEVTQ
jgi:hypothetical protein